MTNPYVRLIPSAFSQQQWNNFLGILKIPEVVRSIIWNSLFYVFQYHESSVRYQLLEKRPGQPFQDVIVVDSFELVIQRHLQASNKFIKLPVDFCPVIIEEAAVFVSLISCYLNQLRCFYKLNIKIIWLNSFFSSIPASNSFLA